MTVLVVRFTVMRMADVSTLLLNVAQLCTSAAQWINARGFELLAGLG